MIKEAVIIVLLVLFAAIPRVIHLDSIPSGLHGDEGWTGIDARKILREGFIGAYSGNALGQPTGPLYVTASVFKLFGESIFSLRFSMALFGIATIGLMYVFLRLFFHRPVSILTSFAFAFSLYHLHFSRIAFMLISAPFFQLLALIFFFAGERKKNLCFIAASGIMTGLGMYSYNSFLLFPITLVGYIVWKLIKSKCSVLEMNTSLVFLGIFFVMSVPLLTTVITKPNFYFSHYKAVSVFNSRAMKSERNISGKFRFFVENGVNNIKHYFLGKKVDGADAFGKQYNYNALYLVLFSIGIIMSMIGKKKGSAFFVISLLFFLSTGFFYLDGIYRRQILSIVYIFYFMGISINYILTKTRQNLYTVTYCILLAVIIIASFQNLHYYFIRFPAEPESYFTFAKDLTDTMKIVKTVNKSNNTIVLFSSRWGCKYETIRFLMPETACEDGSKGSDTHNKIAVLLNSYANDPELLTYFRDKNEIKVLRYDTTVGRVFYDE